VFRTRVDAAGEDLWAASSRRKFLSGASGIITNVDNAVAITGAASGLGRVIANELLAAGQQVILLDRDRAGLELTATALQASHDPSVAVIVADLSSERGIRTAADKLATRTDLVGLVNNAGGWLPGDQYPQASPDKWLSALTLNLVAPMLLTQLLWSRLAATQGAVLNVGSSGGLGDEAYGSPEYGAAKAGLRRFTASLSSRSDVRVMSVIPGWIGLERARHEWAALSHDQRHQIGPLIPPEDIAEIVVTLLTHGRPGEIVDVLRGDVDLKR